MRSVKLIAVIITAILIASCRGSKSDKRENFDGGSDENSGNGGDNPQVLVPADEQANALASWKTSLFKSCTVDSIFYGKNEAQPAIDVAKLHEILEGQLYFEKDGLIALLGEPREFFNYHLVTKIEEHTSSGKQAFKAEQNASDCMVYVNGDKVYQTQLIAGVSLLGSFRRDNNRYIDSINRLPSLKRLNSSDMGQLENLDLSTALLKLFEMEDDSEEQLADYLGLSLTHFRSIFSRNGSWSNHYHAMTLTNYPTVHPFGMDQDLIRGKSSELSSLIPSVREEPIELVFDWSANSQWQKLGIAFDKKLKINLAATWRPLDGQKQTYDLSIKGMETVQPDDKRAVKCFLDRRNDLLSLRKSVNANKFWPEYDSSYCRVFANDWLQLVDKNPAINQLINDLFSDLVSPYPSNFYKWDELLSKLTEKHFYAQDWQHWQHYLNLRVVQDSIANLQLLEEYSANSTEELKLILGNIKSLGSTWAFKDFAVGSSRLDKIFAALNNTALDFSLATSSLWSKVKSDPFGYDAELDFAVAIDDNYKKTAKGMEVPAEATQMTDWYKALTSSVLEKRHELHSMKAWLTTLKEGKDFIETQGGRDGSIPFIESKVKGLMSHALKEMWTKREFNIVTKIAPLAKDKFGCSRARSNIIALAECVGFDDLSNKNLKILAPDFGDRYVELASLVQGWAHRLGGFDFERTRREIVDKFFDVVWKNATSSEFDQAKRDLNSLLNRLIDADWSEQFRIESDIRDLLSKY